MEKPYRYRKKLLKIGGSCVVIIPSTWLVRQNKTKITDVIMEVYKNKIVILPVK